ncbi:unnamed protein product [Mucor hiemalis]
MESIGQPQQDVPDQPPQLFFAIAQPYLLKSNESLDLFLEIRMENEWLRKQLHDMMLAQGGSPISASADISHYQQLLHQLQQNTNRCMTGSSGSYSQHHHLNNQSLDSHDLNYQHTNSDNELNVQYYPPQAYPTTANSNTTAARLLDANNNDLLLGPSAQYYMNSNDSPEFASRRPSSCSSTMFQTNNNNHNNTSTTADDNTNNNWNTTNYNKNHSPSVASSVEVNEMMVQYQQEEHINAEPFSATVISTGGCVATASSYLSSNNSTTTVNTDIAKKEKWKRRKKSRGADDYICADCGTTASPEWRKGPQGPKTLCNACGLRWAKKNKKI